MVQGELGSNEARLGPFLWQRQASPEDGNRAVMGSSGRACRALGPAFSNNQSSINRWKLLGSSIGAQPISCRQHMEVARSSGQYHRP
jgi:hypothetical protein